MTDENIEKMLAEFSKTVPPPSLKQLTRKPKPEIRVKKIEQHN